MSVMYNSTRDSGRKVSASRAILDGLAPDGGLYVPDHIPELPCAVQDLAGLRYQDTARLIMREYLSDFSAEELDACIVGAYDEKFDTPRIAPVREADGVFYLELFHGPTIAFKDMALSILPYLMTTAAKKQGESAETVILTATSGDTGKAALAGFADVPGTKILVFYPKNGVSRFQERQMITQKGENTCVIGIRGNFDDAQSGVKKLFQDRELAGDILKKGFRFSSANSINIGRLVPQIVYYVYAYGQLLDMGKLKAGEPMDVTVPTGNFGNILAAWYAKKMGLPIRTLVCASNENKVLYDFFGNGIYDRNRPFHLTSSPSMDILVSSNLERLLYHAAGDDDKKTAACMKELAEKGRYEITDTMRKNMNDFVGGFADQKETSEEILRLYKKAGYIIDTHTAVASCVCRKVHEEDGGNTPMLVVSTASPFKFASSVTEAVEPGFSAADDFERIGELSRLGNIPVPRAVDELRTAPVRHTQVIDAEEMKESVLRFLTGGK